MFNQYDDMRMETNALIFFKIHSSNRVSINLIVYSNDSLEHISEIMLNTFDILGVANDLKQIFVSHEI